MSKIEISSASITDELLRDLKLKYGSVKIITVVAEEAELDIDNLTESDLSYLKKMGVNVIALVNKGYDVDTRLASVRDFLQKTEEKEAADRKRVAEIAAGVVITAAEQYQFVVRRPDRGHIKMLLPLAKEGKLDDFADKAVKNLVVGGDVDSLEDGIVFMGVVSQLQGMIAPAASFLSRA